MAWCQIGDKQFSDPIMTQFAAAYMSPGFNELNHLRIEAQTNGQHFADGSYAISWIHLMNSRNCIWTVCIYRQFSNISRTQSPNINLSRLVLQLSLPNPLKPGAKLRMKM